MKLLGILAFLAGIVLAGFLVFRAGFAPVAHALATLGLTGLVAIVAAHIPIIVLLGAAWWTIGRGAGNRPLLPFIWARGVRDAAAEALPFSQVGGYVIGGRALSLAGVDATAVGLSTFLDLVLEFAAKIPYVLLGLALLEVMQPSDGTAVAIVAILACAAAAAIALRSRPDGSANRLLERMMARWPQLAASRQKLLSTLREMLSRPAALSASTGLHFLCWLLGAGETWLIFHFMRAPISIEAALIIDSLVGAIRALSFFVPGAIGVQEGGYVLLCGLFGLDPGAALAFSFARRARDILIAAPVLVSWQIIEGQGLLPSRSKS
ncbi:MAG TPA: lysylphosphatidylglycerol synthase domain-containing protein [Rhizomicrobium sp.]|jgi:putative membrane protein